MNGLIHAAWTNNIITLITKYTWPWREKLTIHDDSTGNVITVFVHELLTGTFPNEAVFDEQLSFLFNYSDAFISLWSIYHY